MEAVAREHDGRMRVGGGRSRYKGFHGEDPKVLLQMSGRKTENVVSTSIVKHVTRA